MCIKTSSILVKLILINRLLYLNLVTLLKVKQERAADNTEVHLSALDTNLVDKATCSGHGEKLLVQN